MTTEEAEEKAKLILRTALKDLNITSVRKVAQQLPKQFEEAKRLKKREEGMQSIMRSFMNTVRVKR